MSKGILKYRNPNYVEGGSEPKWITLGSSSGGSTGGSGDTGGGTGGDTTQYEKVNVSISASNGSSITANVTVNGETKSVTSGSSVPFVVEYGTEYTIEMSAVEGFITPEILTFTAEQSTRNVDIVYNIPLITTIRIDQTISDPATMITRIVDNGGIEAIRENSHRYTGTLNGEGVMELKQLDDADSNKYVDGTDANLTTLGTDVWMKLPKFYWKCVEHETDVWDLSVIYDVKPDDTWKEWTSDNLFGVYQSYVSSNKFYSVSGKSPTAQENIVSANRENVYYTFLSFEDHNIIGLLYLLYYCNTNVENILGAGTTANTGSSNHLGMTDTKGGSTGEELPRNFWGLESWGNRLERVLNITDNYGFKYTVGLTHKSYDTSAHGYIKKMIFGENAVLLPKEGYGTKNTGFCESISRVSNTTVQAELFRNGMFGINPCSDVTKRYSRLMYKGEHVII